MPLNLFRRPMTLEEAQEKNEQLDAALTVAQKEAALKRLKEAGLTGKSFGWDWKRIWHWACGR